MYIFFAIYGLLCLWGIRLRLSREANPEYLSLAQTQAVKGIFILLVFFSHFSSYVTLTQWKDRLWLNLIGLVGQGMVTLFLFYSGYGVMESIRKKGKAYIAAMPKNRILATLFRFDCAVILFVILALFLGETLSFSRVVLSFIGWDAVGNSNWYIFAVLALYAITWIAFRLSGSDKPLLGTGLVFLGTFFYILILSFRGLKPMHWYDTALCYPLGMAWSLLSGSKWESLLKKWIPWILALLVSVAGWYIFHNLAYTPINQICTNLFFTLAFVLATMRISLGNPVLNWCGKHLFPLYILQRLPMIALKYLGLHDVSVVLYFLCCLGITAALVYPFEWCTDKLWNRIRGK